MTENTPAKKKAPAARKAKPAPAKKATKAEVAKKAVKAVPAKKVEKEITHKGADAVIFDQFGVRAGSLKEKLLRHLLTNKGKWLESSDLQILLYAKPSVAAKSALGMVMLGIRDAIKKGGLAYVLENQRSEGVTSHRLAVSK